jgi:putative protease
MPPTEVAQTAVAGDPGAVVGSEPSRIGVVTHYFGHVHAAVVTVESGELRVGDMVHVRGHTTDYYQRIDRIEIDHQSHEVAKKGDNAGIHVAQRVRPHDVVFRLSR